MSVGRVLRVARAASYGLLEQALTHPIVLCAVVFVNWMLHLVDPWTWLFVLLTLFFMSVAGGESRMRLSSIVGTEKFVYRRAVLYFKWRRVMLHAKIKQVSYMEDTVGSFKPVPGRPEVPKLYKWRPALAPRRTPCGMVVTVDGSRIGAGVGQFEGSAALSLQSALKLRNVLVDPHPTRPHLVQLKLVKDDPFERIIYPTQLPLPSRKGFAVVGLDVDGEPVEKDLTLPQLIVGTMGAGKSNEVWALLYNCVKQNIPLRIRLLDPKGGMEFHALHNRVYCYEADPTKLDVFLGDAFADLEKRQRELSRLGITNGFEVLGDPRFPLDIMIFDELLTGITLMKTLKVNFRGQRMKATDALMVYLSQGRAALVTAWALSQLGQKDVIGPGLRDMFPYATCLRVVSDEQVRMVLGDANTYPAHRIPPTAATRGIGYANLNGRPTMYRSALVEGVDRDYVADGLVTWADKYRKVAA